MWYNILNTYETLPFNNKWMQRLSLPLTAEDRKAGYSHRLTIWQFEVNYTQAFCDSVQGQEFIRGRHSEL